MLATEHFAASHTVYVHQGVYRVAVVCGVASIGVGVGNLNTIDGMVVNKHRPSTQP